MINLLTCFTLLAATPAEIAMQKQSTIAKEPSVDQIDMKKYYQMLNRMPFKELNQLSEVLSNGLILVFKDMSKWQIESQDAIYTSAWLGPVRIKMVRMENPDAYDFPFEMTNLATKTTVYARRLE